MSKDDIGLLKDNGWTVLFSNGGKDRIRYKDGSFATGRAAKIILIGIREERRLKYMITGKR